MARKKLLNKKVLMSVFIVAIMILSAFGFMMSYRTSQGEKEEYNGFDFIRAPRGLKTKINEQEVYFDYYPQGLENLSMPDDIKAMLKDAKALIVTYDPDSDFATYMAELQFNMEQELSGTGDVYVARGLTNATGTALPEFTCNNATAAMPVLYLKKGEESQIKSEDSCIILTASTEPEMNMFYNKIRYVIYGIMK